MKYKLLAATIAAALSLTGCSKPEQNTTASSSESQSAVQKGSAELGTFGIDLTAMDKAVKPGDVVQAGSARGLRWCLR